MDRCDYCGVERIKLAIISTVEGQKRACSDCLDKINSKNEPRHDIPIKPKFIRFYNVGLAKMGTYEDSNEKRYILSIPKDRKEEFELEQKYDVIFIKR